MLKFLKLLPFQVTSILLTLANTEPEPNKKDEMIDFAVGGQAVIEGVMMRSPNSIAVAVRKPDGDIAVDKRHYRIITQRFKWLNIPILRGMVNLFEMMIVGTKAINYSAAVSLEEPEPENQKPQTKLGKFLEGLMFTFSFILSLGISIFLFKFLPLTVATLFEKTFQIVADKYVLFNIIDGITKMAIFITYIWILTRFESFRRIFQYHGAEHKSIFAYEHKLDLTIPNAKKQSRFHPRCGTSFIFIVFTISILIYTVVPKQPTFLSNFALRVAVLPLIAGISYEYLKLSAKHIKKRWVEILAQPGMWFQRLTTAEPDNTQLEVGIKSLVDTLELEKQKA